jgi:hypothetical protein
VGVGGIRKKTRIGEETSGQRRFKEMDTTWMPLLIKAGRESQTRGRKMLLFPKAAHKSVWPAALPCLLPCQPHCLHSPHTYFLETRKLYERGVGPPKAAG